MKLHFYESNKEAGRQNKSSPIVSRDLHKLWRNMSHESWWSDYEYYGGFYYDYVREDFQPEKNIVGFLEICLFFLSFIGFERFEWEKRRNFWNFIKTKI